MLYFLISCIPIFQNSTVAKVERKKRASQSTEGENKLLVQLNSKHCLRYLRKKKLYL